MNDLDIVAAARLHKKLDLTKEQAEELVNIIRKLAEDEYDKKIGEVPF